MTTPYVRSTMKWMSEAGMDPTEVHWFDISNPASGMGDAWGGKEGWGADVLRDCRPPFEKCMVLLQATKNGKVYELIMSVVGTDVEEGILLSVYRGAHGGKPILMPLLVYLYDPEDDRIKYGPVNEGEKIEEHDAQMALALTAAWYKALNAGSTESYVAEVKQTFTNKRKIAQGKRPTYEWRTVIIEPQKSRQITVDHGGTHASPRLHDRRGHLRRLRSGKNVWVRPCKVGNAALGTVFHDYEVRT